MKQQISLSDCAGKTVRGVAGDYECRVLVFTDGTFAHFKASHGYDGCVELEDKDYKVGDSDASLEQCIAAGLYTAEELEQLQQERQAAWQRQVELGEREQLKRLLNKYGSSPTPRDAP